MHLDERFVTIHGVILNLFRVGWHLLRPANYSLSRAPPSLYGMR